MSQALVMLRLIAEVVVAGSVVPWSAPETFLGGKPGGKRHHVHKKDPRLIAWQDAIRAAIDREHTARCGFRAASRTPHEGPVQLSMTFFKGTDDPTLWGQRWWTPRPCRGSGDLANFYKAAEDALKTWEQFRGKGPARVRVLCWPGLIADDSQVCDSFLRKRYAPEDGARIRVYAIEDGEETR